VAEAENGANYHILGRSCCGFHPLNRSCKKHVMHLDAVILKCIQVKLASIGFGGMDHTDRERVHEWAEFFLEGDTGRYLALSATLNEGLYILGGCHHCRGFTYL